MKPRSMPAPCLVTKNSGFRPGKALPATATIAGLALVLCCASSSFAQITIDPPTRTFGKDGGGGSVLTAGSGAWTATTVANWLTITPRTNGVAGESCIYVVSANFSADTRQGVIVIGGNNHTVTQTGYDATLTPQSVTCTIAGYTGTINVAVAAGVSWSAATTQSWITVHTPSGIGNGSVLYTVAPYGGVVTRVGTIIVGSKTFVVTQTGTDVNISPLSVDKLYSSDIIQVSVTALVGTHWTVTPNNLWITVVDAGNGFGDSVITLAIGTNPSYAPRVGTVSIGSATFTIRQDGVRNPSLDITPTSATADPNGALGNIAVSATPDSPWNSHSQAGWLIIASGTNGSGNGNINYVVSANPTVTTRVGTILVNGAPPNFDARDFSRGALHIFSNRVDVARTDIAIIGGNNYPDFTGTERATMNGYGIKDTHDWSLAFRFRHNSNGEIHRLLYYVGGGRTLALWVDANRKLTVRSDADTFTIETMNFSAGTNYFVLCQGTTNTLDVYVSVLGGTPARMLQIARSSSLFPPNANLMNIQLGGSEIPSSGNYIGDMSLLSIHNRQLTAAEIENYNQAAPWTDVSPAFAGPMFVARGSTNITPTRAFLFRGSLRDQMGQAKARLMDGTSQSFRFKAVTDRFGTPGSALDITNGANCRPALGNNVFRTLSFWVKPSGSVNQVLTVMRSTRPGSVSHGTRYACCPPPSCGYIYANRSTSGNPDYYTLLLNSSGNFGISSRRIIQCPLDSFFNDGQCSSTYYDQSWTTPLTYLEYGSYVTTNRPTEGIWHHMAITVTDAGVVKLYLNGQEAGNTAMYSGNLAGYTFNWMGDEFLDTQETAATPSPAILDDLATYTQELSSAEIATLYSQQKPIQRVHTVTQGALPVSLTPTQSVIGANGGTADLNLSLGGHVSWSASTDAGWLTLSTNAGAGPATLVVEAAANGSVYNRSTTVTAGGQTVSVVQGGRWSAVSTNNEVVPPDGGAVFFDVSAEAGATWEAVSGSSWLTVALGQSGSGNGFVMVVADPYSEYSRARIGTVLIAGHAVYISQCGYALTVVPSAVEIGSNAGAGEFAIVAPLSAVWEAIATAPWITIIGGNSGIGNGTLRYTVVANDTGAIRTGRIIVSGAEYIIQQGIIPTDNDSDGMPNDYELLYGFDIENPVDADEDPDEDHLTNLQEYRLGTNPLIRDTDGDGVPDGAEDALADLGFDPMVGSTGLHSLVVSQRIGLGLASSNDVSAARLLGQNDVMGDPNTFGLYNASQMHGLAMGDLVLDLNPVNSKFQIMFGLQTSANLLDWQNLSDSNITVEVQDGMINAEFEGPSDAFFYRVRSGTQP